MGRTAGPSGDSADTLGIVGVWFRRGNAGAMGENWWIPALRFRGDKFRGNDCIEALQIQRRHPRESGGRAGRSQPARPDRDSKPLPFQLSRPP
jgi:hypothetical protein